MPLKYVKTQSEFESLLASNQFVLANFTASWCGPCKMIAPQVETLAAENPSVVIVKVDIDDNDETPDKYKVSAVPTFLLFKNGVKSGEVVGATYEKVKALVLSAH